MDNFSSNKDSFRSTASPFKLSGQLNGNADGGESILGSSDSGGRQQHRNSKTTEADGLDKLGAPGEFHFTTMSAERKAPPMVQYVKLMSFATPLDLALMTVGASAAVAHGATLPVVLVLLGRVVHFLGTNQDLAYQKICQVYH